MSFNQFIGVLCLRCKNTWLLVLFTTYISIATVNKYFFHHTWFIFSITRSWLCFKRDHTHLMSIIGIIRLKVLVFSMSVSICYFRLSYHGREWFSLRSLTIVFVMFEKMIRGWKRSILTQQASFLRYIKTFSNRVDEVNKRRWSWAYTLCCFCTIVSRR